MKKLEGSYKGKVLNLPLGWIWQGKIFYKSDFTHDKVINRILGFRLITGKVIYCSDCIKIVYPFGLTDVLIPITEYFYIGILQLGQFQIWFSLTEEI